MKKKALDYLDEAGGGLFSLSDALWERPEIAFQETEAARLLCERLEAEGFTVEQCITGIPTAFRASFGAGGPVVALLGEYDALDGMSQQADVKQPAPVPGQRYGHGCGHHALGSAAAYAAIAVKRALETGKLPGTVVFFGCPAEEGGAGKAFMVRDGAFDGVDCAVTWHPADLTNLFTGRCLANISATFRFTGISAHAAGQPHVGRSALDAVELMNVGINYLREHIVPQARLHYAVTDTGGSSPNVVQAHAAAFHYVRAPEAWQVKEIYARVCDIARGAALMTGTKLDITYNRGINSLMPNQTLNAVMHRNMLEIPLPEYTGQEYAEAEAYRATIPEPACTFGELQEPMTRAERAVVTPHQDESIYRFVSPQIAAEPLLYGSTDVGDVSMLCPVVQLHAACYAAGTPLHSWQAVAQGKSGVLHKGELYAAKVMAATVLDLLENPARILEAQAELCERLDGHPFESLLPPEIKPQLMRGEGGA